MECPLTSEQFPLMKRGVFATLATEDVDFFSKLLPGRVFTDKQSLDKSNTDWLGIYRGNSKILLKPKTTAEVSRILAYCNERNLAVVPQGGNTSLAGASVPVFDEIIISLELMNKVIDFNKLSGALVCEAGCTLQGLCDYLEAYGFTMPYKIGPAKTCQVGGNLSTNCGGMYVVRYGTRHSTLLGLEVVLGDGTVLDLMTTMKKDNTGYHLKNMFIGAEGTLGIITKVSLECPVKPLCEQMTFVACPKLSDSLILLQQAKEELNEVLSTIEVFDDTCMKLLMKHLHKVNPFEGQAAECYMLIGTAGSNATHNEEKLRDFISKVKSHNLITSGITVSKPDEIDKLFGYRCEIAVALRKHGSCYKYDVTVPHKYFWDIVLHMKNVLKPKQPTVVGYGHISEGDIHLNVISPVLDPELQEDVEKFLYEWIAKHRGSISSEHGLGIQRRDKISYSKSETAVAMMGLLKTAMDPKGILNPYKVLPVQVSGLSGKSKL